MIGLFACSGPFNTLQQPAVVISIEISWGGKYVILPRKISDINANLLPPALKGEDKGSQGDTSLVDSS